MEHAGGRTRRKRQSKRPVDALLHHLITHAEYDLALLFTKGQYILYSRDGKALRPKGIAPETLRAAFVEEPVDSGWLPQGVLRWGSGPAGTFMVKYIPAGMYRLHLSTQDPAKPRMTSVPLPALVFAGVESTYYVAAVRDEHIGPKTLLFHAPLPNVYEEGRVCFGTNQPPAVSWKTIDAAWRLFLASPFTGASAQRKSVAYPDDVRQQLLACEQAAHYPVDDLQPLVEGRHWYRTATARQLTADDLVSRYLLKQIEKEEEA